MATRGFESDAELGIGEAQEKANEAIDEAGRRIKSEARSFSDRADEVRSNAKEALARAADQAKVAAANAADTYADMRRRAQAVGETVDPFVRESPYAAVAIAVLAGLALGLLMFGGGAKVVYVRPRP